MSAGGKGLLTGSWSLTHWNVGPKETSARHRAASVFYKIEAPIEKSQEDERHGQRKNRDPNSQFGDQWKSPRWFEVHLIWLIK
jgi:hypothetical protein